MFGSKKTITDRVKESLTEYLDAKFEDYRGQIALDLARGLAALAGLVVIWTLVIVCTLFVALTIGLLLGWLLSFFLSSFAYILSFLIIAISLMAAAYYLFKNKEQYIEEPVFKIMSETLRSPETWGIESDNNNSKEPTATKPTKSSKTTSPTKAIPPPVDQQDPPSTPPLPLPPQEDLL